MPFSSLHVEVTSEPLDLVQLQARVTHPSAGAISTFTGTTRDSFGGKAVLRLEYEAYVPMAEAKLRELGQAVAARWDVVGVALAHRVGCVAVCQPSVIIAVSSAHRRDALEVGVQRAALAFLQAQVRQQA